MCVQQVYEASPSEYEEKSIKAFVDSLADSQSLILGAK
jgi:hypothetical protein